MKRVGMFIIAMLVLVGLASVTSQENVEEKYRDVPISTSSQKLLYTMENNNVKGQYVDADTFSAVEQLQRFIFMGTVTDVEPIEIEDVEDTVWLAKMNIGSWVDSQGMTTNPVYILFPQKPLRYIRSFDLVSVYVKFYKIMEDGTYQDPLFYGVAWTEDLSKPLHTFDWKSKLDTSIDSIDS